MDGILVGSCPSCGNTLIKSIEHSLGETFITLKAERDEARELNAEWEKAYQTESYLRSAEAEAAHIEVLRLQGELTEARSEVERLKNLPCEACKVKFDRIWELEEETMKQAKDNAQLRKVEEAAREVVLHNNDKTMLALKRAIEGGEA